MKFNAWVAQEVKRCNTEINEYKKSIEVRQEKLKSEQQQKKALGRKNDSNSPQHEQVDTKISSLKAQIESVKTKISARKNEISSLKLASKMQLVRLKTGAVVSSKMLDEMLKKLSGKHWSIEYTQYKDGLQMAYVNTQSGAKGSLEAYDLGGLPDDVELPLFEKGEVKECSIR